MRDGGKVQLQPADFKNLDLARKRMHQTKLLSLRTQLCVFRITSMDQKFCEIIRVFVITK